MLKACSKFKDAFDVIESGSLTQIKSVKKGQRKIEKAHTHTRIHAHKHLERACVIPFLLLIKWYPLDRGSFSRNI